MRLRAPGLWALSSLLAVLMSAGRADLRADETKVIVAARATGSILVNGVLDEPDWQAATPVSDFVQSEPDEGQPLTERTEVRVLYDDENLYFGVYCHDSEPDRLVTNELTRDFNSYDSDAFGIAIDPFHDHRNGFSFFSNPGAAKRDAQGLSDGRHSNVQWDGIWRVACRTLEDGWSCEFLIPFKTLGITSRDVEVMGINFKRRIRRKNEEGYWSPVPRRFTINRYSLAGHLVGVENIQPGRNLTVKPFARTDVTHQGAVPEAGSSLGLDGGLDVKYRLSRGLTLDLTYNTDFSHVEVDTQQINLTRFSLFFPEKRDFFLENAGLFQFGDVPEERSRTRAEELQLFYSRRIGLSPAGRMLPLRGGARLSGRAGAWGLGLLNIQQEAVADFAPANFTVARVRREILANSDLGAIFINRQSGGDEGYNRTVGFDANLQFRQNLTLNSYVARTAGPDIPGDNWTTKVSGRWENNFLVTQFIFTDIGAHFRPEVGFVPRTGVRNYQLNAGIRLRPTGGGLVREFYPHLNVKYFAEPQHLALTRRGHIALTTRFRDGSRLEVSHNPEFERLERPFRLRPGIAIPAGDYGFSEFRADYSSDASRLFSGGARISRAGFFDGNRTSATFSGAVRVKPRILAETSYQHNLVDVGRGGFRADLYGLRLNYSFSPRMFADAFLQYNADTGRMLSNVRFNLIHRPLSDLTVVLTDDRLTARGTDDARAIIVKYTHLLQF